MCIKMVALRMNLYQEVALSFRKVGDPCSKAWYNQQRQLKLKSTTIVLKVTGNLKQNFCNNKKNTVAAKRMVQKTQSVQINRIFKTTA